jgi:Tol biopolymer transport system component
MLAERPAGTRLDSWKAVAEYLKRDVRTVTRWEERGLPVHRVPGGKRKAVFAFSSEIDDWLLHQDEVALVCAAAASAEAAPETNPVQGGPNAESTPADRPLLRANGARKRIYVAATATCLFLLTGILVFFHFRTDFSVQSVRITRITDDGRVKGNLQTDGATLYFNELEVGRQVLVSTPVIGGPVRIVPTPFSNVALQDISVDGQWLLVLAYEGSEIERPMWIIPAAGGAGRRVGELLCHSARWSPDNRRIACATGTRIVVLNTDSASEYTVGSFSLPVASVLWSPDGLRLWLALFDVVAGAYSPWEIDVPDGNPPILPIARRLPLGSDCCPAWTWFGKDHNFAYVIPNSDLDKWDLFVRPNSRGFARWFGRDTEVPARIGPVAQLADGKTGNSLYAVVSGKIHGELLKFDSSQKVFHTVAPGFLATFIAYSPDRRWMTYVTLDDNSLWRSRMDGTDAIQLTQPPMHVELSSWSPDGRKIAFMGKLPEKPYRIYLIDRDGGSMTEASGGDDNQGAPTWSPDGKFLVYGNVACSETQSCWIRFLNLVTRQTEKLPRSHGLRTARWSPDGKFIAALVPETGELVLYDVKTKRWRVLGDSIQGDNMNWSRDSSFIYADSPLSSNPVIERFRISDGQRTTIVSLAPFKKITGQLSFWFGLSPEDEPLLAHLFTPDEIYAIEWVRR